MSTAAEDSSHSKMPGDTMRAVALPDGTAFSVWSRPLPKDHWLYAETFNAPPMPFRMGVNDPRRQEWAEKIRAAARYAVRGATLNGKDQDLDPDALVSNMVVGMLGYFTADGLTSCRADEAWADPHPTPPLFSQEKP